MWLNDGRWQIEAIGGFLDRPSGVFAEPDENLLGSWVVDHPSPLTPSPDVVWGPAADAKTSRVSCLPVIPKHTPQGLSISRNETISIGCVIVIVQSKALIDTVTVALVVKIVSLIIAMAIVLEILIAAVK